MILEAIILFVTAVLSWLLGYGRGKIRGDKLAAKYKAERDKEQKAKMEFATTAYVMADFIGGLPTKWKIRYKERKRNRHKKTMEELKNGEEVK